MDSIRSYLESKLVKFILDENKYTGWVSPVISDLPEVDKTKIWKDQDLYSHFGLTQEEIDHIENAIK
jgi:site-specific DNA-methyltransferase (adenine-specific)